MRQAVAQALHHAAHRSAFQKRLIDQPLMRSVLADLVLEAEAAVVLALRLARAFDAAAGDPAAASFARLATAVAKFWICKRAPATIGEALECLGGNGYVETSILPRLYREAPVNSVWEGSGNVVCLDVLRTLTRDPGAQEALFAELERARGADLRLDAWLGRGSRTACANRPTPRRRRAAWSSSWRWRSRARSWSSTRRPRSPTPSAPRAWPTAAGDSSGPCRAASIRRRSARGRAPTSPEGLLCRQSRSAAVAPDSRVRS